MPSYNYNFHLVRGACCNKCPSDINPCTGNTFEEDGVDLCSDLACPKVGCKTEPTACNYCPDCDCEGEGDFHVLCCICQTLDSEEYCFCDPDLGGECEGSPACCVLHVGCTDPSACNFDPAAIANDGSCMYCGTIDDCPPPPTSQQYCFGGTCIECPSS